MSVEQIEQQILYHHEPIGLALNETVYALDATTIDLCLNLFPWARFRRTCCFGRRAEA